jgi:hypothetical protein
MIPVELHKESLSMRQSKREQRRQLMKDIIAEHELSRADIADLCHVSIDTVNAWLKPETSKSSNPTPQWAIELIGYKLNDRSITRGRDCE